MNLAREFEDASPEPPDRLEGRYAVHLVGDGLPWPLRFFGHTKVFRATPSGVVGFNEFLGGSINLGHFRVGRGASSDGAEVTAIDYDTPVNPAPLRLLTDEVRRVGEGRYLGRGRFRLFGRSAHAFWFTVTKEP